jgi:drug/metabolite transporter (DMT)-like permease
MDVETLVEAPAQRPKHHGRILWFSLLLAIANLMWAGQFVAVKYLQDFIGPFTMTLLPFYIATLMLLPLLFWKRARNPSAARPVLKDWIPFIIAGAIGQAATQVGSNWGVTKSTASNAAILNLLIPVLTAFLAPLMLRERVTRLEAGCLFLGLIGVMLMSMQDLKQTALVNRQYLLGNLGIFIGCAGSAFYNVYCKGLMAKFGEIEILIYTYITASLTSIPFLIWIEPNCLHRLTTMNTAAWIAFIFLAVFMYGASMVLFFYVLRYLPVTVASASLYLLPIFGVALGMILLGDRLNAWQVVGGAVVLVSTILIMRYDPTA